MLEDIYLGYVEVPVLYIILHVQVIDEQRVSQFGITHCLIQRESWFTRREMIRQDKIILFISMMLTSSETVHSICNMNVCVLYP